MLGLHHRTSIQRRTIQCCLVVVMFLVGIVVAEVGTFAYYLYKEIGKAEEHLVRARLDT